MSALTGDLDLRPKPCQFCPLPSDAALWRDCWLHGPHKICPNCGNCPGPFAHGPDFAKD